MGVLMRGLWRKIKRDWEEVKQRDHIKVPLEKIQRDWEEVKQRDHIKVPLEKIQRVLEEVKHRDHIKVPLEKIQRDWEEVKQRDHIKVPLEKIQRDWEEVKQRDHIKVPLEKIQRVLEEVKHRDHTNTCRVSGRKVEKVLSEKIQKVEKVMSKKIQKVVSKKIQREQLKLGDHIYTWRPNNSKSHGIYDGDGKVVHLAVDKGPRVLCTGIDKFLDGGKLYLFEYGLNPVLFLAKPPGGATCIPIDGTPESVMDRASSLLKNGFTVCKLFKNNSEDFAVYCKTQMLRIRDSWSQNAAYFLAATSSVFFHLLTMFPPPVTITGLAAAGVVMYCICRYKFDAGARQNVGIDESAVERLLPLVIKESGFLPKLKDWSILAFSAWVYLSFEVPERIMLCCRAIFKKNFNFGSWVLNNKIRADQLQPGDHIYTWRDYAYAHHGIYMGNGEVIHAVRGRGALSYISRRFKRSSGTPGVPTPAPSGYLSDKYVERIKLKKFLSGGDLYRYEYGVTRGYFIARIRGGTCTTIPSQPTKDVLKRAEILLNYKHKNLTVTYTPTRYKLKKRRRGKKLKVVKKRVFGPYDLFRNNCEDFAIFCKTGLVAKHIPVGMSGQVACVLASAAFLIYFNFPSLCSNLTRMVGGFFIYSIFRMFSDINYRWDTIRIPVDKLSMSESSGVVDISE